MKTRYDAYLLEWNIPHEVTLFIKSNYNESVLNIFDFKPNFVIKYLLAECYIECNEQNEIFALRIITMLFYVTKYFKILLMNY